MGECGKLRIHILILHQLLKRRRSRRTEVPKEEAKSIKLKKKPLEKLENIFS